MITIRRIPQLNNQDSEQRKKILIQKQKVYKQLDQAVERLKMRMQQTEQINFEKRQKQLRQKQEEQIQWDRQLAEELRLASQNKQQNLVDTGNGLSYSHIMDFVDKVSGITVHRIILPLVKMVFQKNDQQTISQEFISKLANQYDSIAQRLVNKIEQIFQAQNQYYVKLTQQIMAKEQIFSAQKIAYVHYRQFQNVFRCARQQFEQNEEIKKFSQKIDEQLHFLKGIKPEKQAIDYLPSLEFKKSEELQQNQKGLIKGLLTQMQPVIEHRIIKIKLI